MFNLFTYLAGVYGISELMLSLVRKSDRKQTVIKRDRGSMALIWLVMFTFLTLGFYYSGPRYLSTNYFTAITGILVYLAGMTVRWVSILQLKKAFTVDVAVTEGQRLKTNGLYSIVRHPSYLGILLIITGLGIGMNNIIGFLITVLPVFFALNYRIIIEEKLLTEFFGKEYTEYSSYTRRIIPWIY